VTREKEWYKDTCRGGGENKKLLEPAAGGRLHENIRQALRRERKKKPVERGLIAKCGKEAAPLKGGDRFTNPASLLRIWRDGIKEEKKSKKEKPNKGPNNRAHNDLRSTPTSKSKN